MRYLWSPEGLIGMLLFARLVWIACARVIRAVRPALNQEATPLFPHDLEAW